MSAPRVMIFLPSQVDDSVLKAIVNELSLSVDHLPPGFPFDFSAQRRDSTTYILIEYSKSPRYLEDFADWERPSLEYKRLIADSKATLTITYRGIELAKRCLIVLAQRIGVEVSARSVLENGRGCLLFLSEVKGLLSNDTAWSWEKDAFPELPGVAPSEWAE